MILLVALVLLLLFAGLGFFVHILWLGLVAVAVLLVAHMVHQGLTRNTPTSRLNLRLVAAARGFLDDVLESRARGALPGGAERGGGTRERFRRAKLKASARAEAESTDEDLFGEDLVHALEAGESEVVDAEIVEESQDTDAGSSRAVAQPVMTPAKIAKAAQMERDGMPRSEIARRLGVSRSVLHRHLSEHRKAEKARARAKA